MSERLAETAMRTVLEAEQGRSLDRLLPKAEVLRVTGWSDTTLWRESKAKRFPASVQTSPGRIGWLQSEVETWMQQRVEARSARKGRAA
jgi:prophage regulatory protein